ncbi:MAG: hypothetical protein E7057_05295 [Lentisphaerae bacterium]|nr:hypothetical protein [Lentisphaerota bacterium]
MQIDFRIDWGYQYLYSRRHYHPFYHWDGSLECENGSITGTYQLDYPVIWFGPGHCARETRLPEPRWQSTTRRGMAGVRITADVEENAVFHLKTFSGNFDFTAADILNKGRIEFPVGPKYLGCHVIVTRTGYYWFQPQAKPGQSILEADDLSGSVPVRDWARMRTAWIAPGEKMSFEFTVPESKADFSEQLLHVVCMVAPEYTPGDEKQAADYFPIRLYCDGELVAENTRFYRHHDVFMQLLEDLWLRFKAAPGKHKFELENGHERYCFLVNRLVLQQSEYAHLQFSLPQWALTGEEQIGRIFAVKPDHVTVKYPGNSCELTLVPGWNEFRFVLSEAGKNVPFTAGNSCGVIPEVYALANETPEVTVGFDMTTVPHDHSGTMDWILDYTWRTQLGNIVVFRSFLISEANGGQYDMVDEKLLERWGNFCRTHKIHVEAATDFDNRQTTDLLAPADFTNKIDSRPSALVTAAGNMLHSVGAHEWPGAVYAFDPQPGWESTDMKMAMENCLKRLKLEVDRAHKAAPRAAFGDASGGHRYCYMAGADFIRTETMVPHTQHLCSQARPAAEVFRDGEWGVHIAIQHPYQPYHENHLGQYYLSIFQPWMMGANMIYEEDCLFNLFKEERQAWDDALTKGKRDMTREFFKFVKTHPRKGKVVRKIAFVEGRYAAPFNGFICDVEQTPDYSVWGLFGNNAPEWGHNQVEKCRQVLDVLMPGASTQPLRQDFSKRRFFFSGTPYGDFDEVPTEAQADYLKQYSLLLHMGWNTMIAEDYDKLREFVRDGGTLLIGLTQFSTHVKRDFLRDMKDLALWNDGDLSEFCGVKVKGAGELFSGDWNAADRNTYPEVSLSAIPSKNPAEDGECRLADIELAGAEPFIWDSAKKLPLVVRHRYGKGVVYLLTAYAYFGHEELQKVMARLVAKLAEENQPECRVIDPSGEVFWNMWDESAAVKRLMLLNTDWTRAGNAKKVTVVVPKMSFETDIIERQAKIFTITESAVIETPVAIHVEVIDGDHVKLYGNSPSEITVRHKSGVIENYRVSFKDSTETVLAI